MENGSILKSPRWDPDIECPMLECIAGVMEMQRCFLSLVLKSETAYYCQCQKEWKLDLGLNLIYLKVFCFPDVCINWETN